MKLFERIHIIRVILILFAVIFYFAIKIFIWNNLFECPFHSVTGLYCPGCGGLRSINNLLHGDIFAALRCNLLLGITLLCVPVVLTVIIKNLVKGRSYFYFNIKFLTLVLMLITIFTIIRNISYYPFTILRP